MRNSECDAVSDDRFVDGVRLGLRQQLSLDDEQCDTNAVGNELLISEFVHVEFGDNLAIRFNDALGLKLA